MFHGCSTTHDTPRCSTSVRWTLVEHSWNTRGTLVEHSWNTSDPWGLYSSVGSAHKHSWNTRGTRQVDPDTVIPAHAWPFCGWSPVRIPIEHGFAFFQADHRFESGSCKNFFQVVMGSNPGLGRLLSTFAVVTGSSPGRAKRWSFYRMFHDVPRVFHECSTSVPRVLALHSWNIVACPGVVEHPWNTRGTSWTRTPQ